MLRTKSGRSSTKNAFAFIILVLQTSATVLVTRYSRIMIPSINDDSNDIHSIGYASTAAVCLAEFGKMWVGIVIELYNIKFNKSTTKYIINNTSFGILMNKVFGDTIILLKMAVPAFVYAIQNNLLFIALHYLDSSLYQVVYQLKTITAALFSVLLLSKKYTKLQWISFMILAIGAALANISQINLSSNNNNNNNKVNSNNDDNTHLLIGIFCVLTCTMTSGFAGVWMQMQLQDNKTSLYVKNIQLGMFGVIGTLFNSYIIGDYINIIKPYGLLHGFNMITYSLVSLNIFGGYLVAYVIKGTSNIVKAFAGACSVVFVVIGSWIFFNTNLNIIFWFGAIFVIIGNIIYNRECFKPNIHQK